MKPRVKTSKDVFDQEAPLADRLRDEAQQYDPEPPPALHRAIMSALANTPAPAAQRRYTFDWKLLTGGLAAVIALGIVLTRHHTAPQANPSPIEIVSTSPKTADPFRAAHPIALAERWVGEPFETELQQLVSDLSRPGAAALRVLPATVKRSGKSATQQTSPIGA